ncbi:MAG: phospholipase A [Azonexaceae bacterium]|nr:phospholipase A [Azonexaceae bacterium]
MIRRPLLAALTLLLAAVAPPAVADAGSLEDCRGIADNSARLACYDALNPSAVRAAIPTTPFSAPPPDDTSPAATLRSSSALPTLLGHAWELDDDERGHILRIRPYKPVYVLPLFHTTRANHAPTSPAAGHSADRTELNDSEAKLQISLKTKLYEDLFGSNGDLWFGFTQTSRWQVYNPGDSRPFRETNYEPEAMLVWRSDLPVIGDWRWRYTALGINHQSNGRSLPLSRSWNRVVASFAFEKQDWTLTLRPWWRIPEKAERDDNPDIADYLGRGDLQIVRRWGQHQLSLLLRHSLRVGNDSHGAVQMDYAFPIAGELRGHLQWFSGYGESMIDYNHRANYFGVGVSLIEWY